ncbi:MAG: hypothetical protein ACLP5H_29765 [Desulfomonilaceae bacterium]
MISSWKGLAVIVLCGSILVFVGLANIGGSSQERPISVSVETSPCKDSGTEKIKIALKTEVNGSGLHHGRVVLWFWLLGETAATCPVHFEPIEGYTDHRGRFISQWCPPCPGKYLVCARVSKSGCTCSQAVSHFVVSK